MRQTCLASILILLFSPLIQAQEAATEAPVVKASEEARFVTLGHNVTQTANGLPPGRCTVGTTILACGAGSDLTFGTSPWLWGSYNMYNIYTRWQIGNTESHKTAFQAAYFKTYETGKDTTRADFTGYQMESAWVYWIQSHPITKDYTFHWNIQGAYYWNDRKPFSIRRPQVERNPWQFNLMTLHEVRLVGNFVMQGELGILGVTERWPALHSGVTFGYQGHSWAFQFGASGTGPLSGWFGTSRHDYHADAVHRSSEGFDRKFTDDELSQDFSIHPEIFIQYVFDFM
jgi:hypothetical protein